MTETARSRFAATRGLAGRGWAFTALLGLATAVTVAFLLVPVVAVFAAAGPGELLQGLGDPAAIEALWLSLRTTAIALVVIVMVGTPAAYLLASRSFRGRSVLVTLVELPLVLPPAVAGIGLLAALGPSSPLGAAVAEAGLPLVFETAGVVVAITFVASPFYVRQALAAFEAVDPELSAASRTLGAGEAATLLRVVLPAARAGLASGLALAWGRGLGEFGATLVFAGSLQGVTQTAPLAIVERFGQDFTAALALSAVLVAVSAGILLAVKALPSASLAGTRASR